MNLIKNFCFLTFAFVAVFANAQVYQDSSDIESVLRLPSTGLVVLPGDVDCDGVLTSNDVKELEKSVLDSSYELAQKEVADLNYDGKIDVADITALIDELIHPSFQVHNGHVYRDIGLNVRWAVCNLGAMYPHECGDYYAWGETQPKTCYNWSTYKWMTPGKASWDYVTKYTVPDNQSKAIWYNNYQFVGDGKGVLDSVDDAALINWGGNWRMPTSSELNSLRTKCKWTWTCANGMNGYKVVGPNGKAIFLPATGYYEDDTLYEVGSYADYWSKTLDGSDSDYAFFLVFDTEYVFSYSFFRYYGQSIRPVCP